MEFTLISGATVSVDDDRELPVLPSGTKVASALEVGDFVCVMTGHPHEEIASIP